MSKYGNVKTKVDGIIFDSRREAMRYQELKLLEKAKVISGLTVQPGFRIAIHDKLICTYKADFRYIENGKEVVEDCKGFRTAVYRLKKKLVEALYEIKIIET